MTLMQRFSARRLPTVVLISTMFALMTGIVIWQLSLTLRATDRHLPVIAVTERIPRHVVMFHLWLEEYLAGDHALTEEDIFAELVKAETAVNALLSGGEFDGHGLPAVSRDEIHHNLLDVTWRLDRLASLARNRMRLTTEGAPGERLDRLFDREFMATMNTLDELGMLAHQQFDVFKIYSRILTVVLLACFALLAYYISSAIVFRNREGRRLIERLEQEIIEKESATQHALAANAAKSSFLAMMSHELRTPLNAINGFSEMMLLNVFGPIDNSEYEKYTRYINESGTRLLDLINMILDYSKAQAGRLELREEVVDIADLIGKKIIECQPEARRKQVTLTGDAVPDLPHVHADLRLLASAVANLVSNAVKFTPDDGTVNVRARRTDGGDLEIAVSDSGIGMTEEEVALALMPFKQVDNSFARRHAGTGLGLPFTKMVMELHGGYLDLASRPNVGTVATLSLPRERTIEWQEANASISGTAAGAPHTPVLFQGIANA